MEVKQKTTMSVADIVAAIPGRDLIMTQLDVMNDEQIDFMVQHGDYVTGDVLRQALVTVVEQMAGEEFEEALSNLWRYVE